MVIKDGKVLGAGVILINENQSILFCQRSDNQGWCFPGGKVDEGETFLQTAKRELLEETGIIADDLELVGTINSASEIHGEFRDVESKIWASKNYRFTKASLMPNFEITDFRFVPINHLDRWLQYHELFAPTKKSLELFLEWYKK